jgi:hypothetical protein
MEAIETKTPYVEVDLKESLANMIQITIQERNK